MLFLPTGADFTNTFRSLSQIPCPASEEDVEDAEVFKQATELLMQQCASLEELKAAYKPSMDPRYNMSLFTCRYFQQKKNIYVICEIRYGHIFMIMSYSKSFRVWFPLLSRSCLPVVKEWLGDIKLTMIVIDITHEHKNDVLILINNKEPSLVICDYKKKSVCLSISSIY